MSKWTLFSSSSSQTQVFENGMEPREPGFEVHVELSQHWVQLGRSFKLKCNSKKTSPLRVETHDGSGVLGDVSLGVFAERENEGEAE
jgi:hypothetical protein